MIKSTNMKHITSLISVLVLFITTHSQVISFELIDYQRIITPSIIELNDAISNDMVEYEKDINTGQIIAHKILREEGYSCVYVFNFNDMTCRNINTPYETVKGKITSILFQEENIDFPSQFKVSWENDTDGDDTMYCYTFDVYGNEVFLSLYETNTHPWNENLTWVKELKLSGYFTNNFYLTYED
jgi:hypothetical protein